MNGHSSSRPVTVLLLFASVTSSALGQSKPSYFTVNGSLVLTLPPLGKSAPITSIVWTHNKDLVAEWLKGDVEYYRSFIGRTNLDLSTGTLTINPTTVDDQGVFEVEINNLLLDVRYNAAAIKKVPKPSFYLRTLVCSQRSPFCTFTCKGDRTGAEPVIYSWRKENGLWEPETTDGNFTIYKGMENVKFIQCRMKNPVSYEESNLLPNPFYVLPSGKYNWLWLLLVPVAAVAAVGIWKREFIKKKCVSDADKTTANEGETNELNENKVSN